MPVTFRSNAWLPERDNKLKPKVFSASSASGEVRNPLPCWTVSPFSATADSKLVNTTSPCSSPWITGTAAGAVARISDRIIDCPAKVIVIVADCGRAAAPIANKIADSKVRHIALANNRPVFNIVAICMPSCLRVRGTRNPAWFLPFKLISALALSSIYSDSGSICLFGGTEPEAQDLWRVVHDSEQGAQREHAPS